MKENESRPQGTAHASDLSIRASEHRPRITAWDVWLFTMGVLTAINCAALVLLIWVVITR